MAKSLEQINREFIVKKNLSGMSGSPQKKNKASIGTVLSNIFFYSAIVFMVVAACAYTLNTESNRSVLGYRVFHVLSGSMESVYPKGSLVVVKQEDASAYKEGDDITFYINEDTSKTHRIVEVIQNYDGTGATGFRTWGVENTLHDSDIVHEKNVVGKVVVSVPALGAVLSYLTDNIWLAFVILLLIVLLSFAVKIFIGELRKDYKVKSA